MPRSRRTLSGLVLGVMLGLSMAWLPGTVQAQAQGQAPLQLRIVGGLAGVNQFTRHEAPFWTQELPRLTQGQVRAEIVPFDRAGIRGEDMLQLLQLGAIPFGTAILNVVAAQEPVVTAADLTGLNPDMQSLKRSVAAFRPFLERLLRERRGIELLALYTYPAQVVFCNRAFASLADLAGRRVRVSSASQADLVEAIGAKPVHTGFAEIMPNMRNGNLDCAITGTMSGNTIGLHEVTTHVHTMALNWGLAAFGANRAAWAALPPDLRLLLQRELQQLEAAIWAESERESGEGLACNTGAAGCAGGKRGRMVEVRATPEDDERRRQIFAGTVLPRWVQRCGGGCAETWNHTIGAQLGLPLPAR